MIALSVVIGYCSILKSEYGTMTRGNPFVLYSVPLACCASAGCSRGSWVVDSDDKHTNIQLVRHKTSHGDVFVYRCLSFKCSYNDLHEGKLFIVCITCAIVG